MSAKFEPGDTIHARDYTAITGTPIAAAAPIGTTTHLGLPADFLVTPDGALVGVHNGRHADDQWTVDEVLDLSRSSTGKGTP